MSWLGALLSRGGLISMLSGVMEGLGLPWPGSVLLAAAGAESSSETTALLLAAAFSVFYTAASWVQYFVGYYAWKVLARFIPSQYQKKIMVMFERYGELAVLWSRPLAVGNYVSLSAGVIRMNQPRFLVYTFVGIAPWAVAIALGGSLLGRYLAAITPYLTTAAIIVGVVGGVVMLLRMLYNQRHRHPPAAPHSDPSEVRGCAD